MKAKYIGDPSQSREGPPETFEAFGVTFNKGKFSNVPDGVAAKFKGNSHYETSDAKAPQLDRDQDGGEGGSKAEDADADAAEKAQIRADLDALGAEQPHPRTGIVKLREALEAATAAKD